MPTNPYRGSLKNAAARRGGITRTKQLHIERTLLCISTTFPKMTRDENGQ